jgi:pimeloyl-ACP methyl ester carboxylesterase
MINIESLLSARLFLQPQLVGERIFFISNLSGHLSLYAMNFGGSVPEPLIPPNIALQNPHLIGGSSFFVFPKLGQILVMIDQDGDENYQPRLVPIQGGFPEETFTGFFAEYRVHLGDCDPERNIAYFVAESRQENNYLAYRGNLESGELVRLGESTWGSYPDSHNRDHTKAILTDGYTSGDETLYLWTQAAGERRLLYGVPLEQRQPGQEVPLNAIFATHFTPRDQGLLFGTVLFEDTFGLGYMRLDDPQQVKPVSIQGLVHHGQGEFENLIHLAQNRFCLLYNIDGCSWLYEAVFDEGSLTMTVQSVICGQSELSNGVLESMHYDRQGDRLALSFSTATSPTQIYTVGAHREEIIRHTNERILGVPQAWLSAGEDASYVSFDGTPVSARLYLPAEALGFQGPRPVVYYIHGGPQGQERPDFAWFSMPLIEFLTLKGLAVFVPNVRGSTGYGMQYTKQVDKDWGGKDHLDHVHAMQQVLPKDPRLDASRAGVVGRSYGGYMTLTLASRHTQLWRAAVDMFGPYDLITFMDRLPATWKPYFNIVLGDPSLPEDRQFLEERSPHTYMDQIDCPLLVIQGKNDPRVIEQESRDVVENLKAQGKQVEYLMFENEGHDVLKFENRVSCYNAISEFFSRHLKP